MGVFMGGPEIRETPSLILTGSASYNGIAAVLHASRYGTDVLGVPRGTEEFGELSGNIRLTANFGTERISGLVDNVHLSYIGVTPGEKSTRG